MTAPVKVTPTEVQRELAAQLYRTLTSNANIRDVDPVGYLASAIAQAVAAERERCAGIAETAEFWTGLPDLEAPLTQQANDITATRRAIAAAIRQEPKS